MFPTPGPKCPERPAVGERLRPHRPGLHHGLRHSHLDQLCPRRHLHGGNLPQPGRGRLPVGPAAETSVSGGLSGGHDLQHAADRAFGGHHQRLAYRPLRNRPRYWRSSPPWEWDSCSGKLLPWASWGRSPCTSRTSSPEPAGRWPVSPFTPCRSPAHHCHGRRAHGPAGPVGAADAPGHGHAGHFLQPGPSSPSWACR